MIRSAIDTRVQIEPRTWLVRAVFGEDVLPFFIEREIGFFDGDGDLIVVVAGAAFAPRSLGGFDYILEKSLVLDRAAEGAVIVTAPDWELFDHTVITLTNTAHIINEQFDQRMAIRALQAQLNGGAQ